MDTEPEYVNMFDKLHNESLQTLFTFLNKLPITELLRLAATNKIINTQAKKTDTIIRITDSKTLNLDVYEIFTSHQLRNLHKIFPNTRNIKLTLKNAPPTLFHQLTKFQQLQYIHILVTNDEYKLIPKQFKIGYIKIYIQITAPKIDHPYALLSNIHNLTKYYQVEGILSDKAINKLKYNNLQSLKLKNVLIQEEIGLLKLIFENKHLIELKLIDTKEQSLLKLTTTLMYNLNLLNIEKFTFCLNQKSKSPLEQLQNLKTLKTLKIFYNIKDPTNSLDQVINTVKQLKNVSTEFIEYLKLKNKPYKKRELKKLEKISSKYAQIISNINFRTTVNQWKYIS